MASVEGRKGLGPGAPVPGQDSTESWGPGTLGEGGGEGGGVSGVSIHVAGVCWVHTCAQAPSWVQGHNGDHTQAGALPSC